MRRVLPVLGLASGFAACTPPAMLVHDVWIDGYDLVIERCPVTSGDLNALNTWRSCSTRRMRISTSVGPVARAELAVPTPRDAIQGHIGFIL